MPDSELQGVCHYAIVTANIVESMWITRVRDPFLLTAGLHTSGTYCGRLTSRSTPPHEGIRRLGNLPGAYINPIGGLIPRKLARE